MYGTFHIDLPKYPKHVQKFVLEQLFESWTRLNGVYLLSHPNTPRLYQTDVIYRREMPEVWKDIPSIIEDGCDDCEGLACWLAAELRIRDKIKGARVALSEQRTRTNRRLWHAIVVDNASRRKWDPSKKLGMGGPNDKPATKQGRVKCR
jgi:hypothetical protein